MLRFLALLVFAAAFVLIIVSVEQAMKPKPRAPTTTAELVISFRRGAEAREQGVSRLARPVSPNPALERAWDSGWEMADRVLTHPRPE